MQGSKSYMKVSGHFLEKIKPLGCMPDDPILVATDMWLYLSIPHQVGLIALNSIQDGYFRSFWVFKGFFDKHSCNFVDVNKTGYSRPS